MASKTEAVLRKALAQIRSGKGDKARPTLVDLLRREPENQQAWFLLSFVLDDPQKQQYALLQALKIAPTFERARERLQKLRGEDAPTAEIPKPSHVETKFEPTPLDETPQAVPAFFPDSPIPEDLIVPQETAISDEIPEAVVEESASKKRSARGLLVGIIILLLIVIAGYAAINFLPSFVTSVPTATPTNVASQTLPPSWTPTVTFTATSTNTPIPTATSTPLPTETASSTP
jgi:hypothetical protein